MSIFLYLHVIAAKRGDGLRAELVNALKQEHILDEPFVLTERGVPVCPETLDASDVACSDARKNDATAK
ncbi:hypothetical protein [Rhizobium multihospitium]|uniref:Uncharacterized protein n=1 Tax=Rhizobium multihospitium TaxID=410764 RepID=A0A1C3WPN4_9HYPH|nr:hypothetical protein [Rhizobium multihospitium]SCB42043.1 hypothetical protein GA0061103_5997 [Rhizobium multihospitium]